MVYHSDTMTSSELGPCSHRIIRSWSQSLEIAVTMNELCELRSNEIVWEGHRLDYDCEVVTRLGKHCEGRGGGKGRGEERRRDGEGRGEGVGAGDS